MIKTRTSNTAVMAVSGVQLLVERTYSERVDCSVADSGRGMDPGELLKYLSAFGGGHKPIGEAHENFGLRASGGLQNVGPRKGER